MRVNGDHNNILLNLSYDYQFLALLDETGTILNANTRMLNELKLENPDQVKISFFDLIQPVHFESFRKALQYSVNSINPYPVNLTLKNGADHPMKWQVSFLTRKKEGVNTFFCSGVPDKVIPSEKNNDYDEILSEDLLNRAFVNNTPNLLWAVDEEANLIFANKPFLNYFRQDENILNKKITEFLPPAVSDSLYSKHLKVLQTKMFEEFSEEGRLADGSAIHFRINLFLTEDNSGKKMVAGIASDQTDRKKLEKKLEAANERLGHFNHITSEAIWEWNMKTGKIIRNERLIELTGFLPDDQKGLSWWLSRVHPEDIDQLNEKLKEVTDKSLQSWNSEYRFRCADGEYKNMLDRGYVIYEKGLPVKMIGSLNDITNEKLMENILTEEKLRHYKNITEATIRVQEQERVRFGREMHDNVNQILSTIKMFVGLLTPANDDEQAIKQKTIEYTIMAIEEIRKLSREMVAPQLEGSALTDSIRKIIDDIEMSTSLKIKFTHDAETELLSPGKKLTLFRIVQEQTKNILKYSKAAHVEILLQSSNNYVVLVIKDNGLGFDMKKTNYGVGLSGITERVKFYDGKSLIQSAPGQGCLLEVKIPIKDVYNKAY